MSVTSRERNGIIILAIIVMIVLVAGILGRKSGVVRYSDSRAGEKYYQSIIRKAGDLESGKEDFKVNDSTGVTAGKMTYKRKKSGKRKRIKRNSGRIEREHSRDYLRDVINSEKETPE